MAWTGIHYEKWLWGDNSINIQGRIMVLVHCPFPYCHLSINQFSFKFQTVVLKLPDRWTDGQTDRQSSDYMLYFCRFCVVICFFIPATKTNDLRLRRIFYPRFYPLHYFPILILEKEPVFSLLSVEC